MKGRIAIFWSIFIAVAVFRLIGTLFVSAPDIKNCLGQTISGEGVIVSEPIKTDSGQNLIIEASGLVAEGNNCKQNLQIKAKTKLYPTFSYGDKITFSGKINQPFNFSSGDDGRIFDYRGYLAKDDVYYEIKSAKIEISKTPSPIISWQFFDWQPITEYIVAFLLHIKAGFVANLNRVLGEPHSALAAGLVVGEKAALGKDLLADFRTVGLIHIVVLSGFNITIVATAIKKVLAFLPRIWGIVLGGLGIVMFGILVGGGATVVRSCFMASIALFADLIRRDYNVVRALFFAGLLMLIQNPMILLHDPSFQLSFLATLGLIVLAGPLEKLFGFLPDIFGLRGIVASTFATQIFVSPYILYMMGQLSLIGALVNILVLPFIPITMLMVFLTGGIGFLSLVVSEWFGYISHILLSYELFMVESFAKLPFASLKIPAFSFWWVAAFYGVFGLVYWSSKRFSAMPQLRFAKKSST